MKQKIDKQKTSKLKNYFGNLLNEFSKRNIKQWLSIFYRMLKKDIGSIIHRMKNLKQSNMELVFYHFRNGNINDAILRLKLLMFFDRDNSFLNYHLGKCYFEKLSFKKAEENFQKYLASDKPEFSAETEYYMKIINNRAEEINEIPIKVVEENFNRAAKDYNRIFNFKRSDIPQRYLYNVVNSYINEKEKLSNQKALDLGCGTGVIGHLLFGSKTASSITGVDVSSEMLKYAEQLDVEEIRSYSNLEHSNLKDFFEKVKKDKKHQKYDIIIASNLITYFADLNYLFDNIFRVMNDTGIAVFSFRNLKSSEEKKKEYIKFSVQNEQFYYAPEYVMKVAKKHKLSVSKEENFKFSNSDDGSIFLFTKNK